MPEVSGFNQSQRQLVGAGELIAALPCGPILAQFPLLSGREARLGLGCFRLTDIALPVPVPVEPNRTFRGMLFKEPAEMLNSLGVLTYRTQHARHSSLLKVSSCYEHELPTRPQPGATVLYRLCAV